MFSAPERPDGQMERWTDGPNASRAIVPSFQLSLAVSVCGQRIRLHGRAHAHQIAVAVRAVHAAHRRPHLVLAGPRGPGRPAPARGGGGPRTRGYALPRVRRARAEGGCAPLPSPPPL